MSKQKLIGTSSNLRRDILNHYRNKYFNLFMSRYIWSGDIDYQQANYIMRKFWETGSVACFKIAGTDNLLCFCPFAPTTYNIYDFPVTCTLVNTRGVSFIPSGLQTIDKDVVLGYIQENKKGIAPTVNHYIDNIVEAEIAIRQNIECAKTPWIGCTTPENENKLKVLFNKIHDGDGYLFMSSEEVKDLVILQGGQYQADKLYNYIQSQENAIREFLGFKNLGNMEKKEHFITSEVEANNEVTTQSNDAFLKCLNQFCDGIADVLGCNVNVEINEITPDEEPTETEKEQDEEI